MTLRATLLVFAVLALPAVADAITIRDIIALTKAGLPDEVLTAVIEADRTIFTLDAEQILELRKAGVSDAVLLKMVRSRREFEPAPAPLPQESALPPQEVAPQVVIIGGTPREEDVRTNAPTFEEGRYYFVPFPLWGSPAPRHPRVPAAPFLAPDARGFGRFMNDGWIGRP
jgi:hypothetical protein